jgi:hypothetical protein
MKIELSPEMVQEMLRTTQKRLDEAEKAYLKIRDLKKSPYVGYLLEHEWKTVHAAMLKKVVDEHSLSSKLNWELHQAITAGG